MHSRFAAIIAAATTSVFSASLARAGDAAELMQALDRAGRSGFFWNGALAKSWQADAVHEAATIELPVLPTADRTRVLRRFVSTPRQVPEEALQAAGGRYGQMPGAWRVYWRLTYVEPVGEATPLMFSMAQRRLVQCETGRLFEAGELYFVSLDTSGEPYGSAFDYDNPRGYPLGVIAANSDLRAEFRTACLATSALAADSGATRKRPIDALALDERKSEDSPAVQPSLTGAAAQEGALVDVDVQSRPTTSKSRIRLFQQNGISGGLTDRAACVGDDSNKNAGSGFWKVLGSTFGVVSNSTIGMPETESTRGLSGRDLVGSKAYYFEREVTASAPATINYAFGSPATSKRCSTVAVTFVPEPGADYEAQMQVSQQYCMLTVRRIARDGTLVPVPIDRAAQSCPPVAH